MMADVTMLYDRLLVRVLEGDETTSGGLVVPQIVRDNTPYLRGEVLAVGTGRITPNGDTVPLSVKEGDVVIFFRSAGGGEQLMFPGKGTELLIIREPHVCCILRDLPKTTGLLDLDGRMVVQ